MSEASSEHLKRVQQFCRLHDSGLFVMPNPWDGGSAKYLAHLGFSALATTSSGAAFAAGRSDGALTLAETLHHIRTIVDATTLPVNADFEDGHARDLEELDRNVRACVATGVAGLSIEDATGDAAGPLYEFGVAVDRIRTAKQAIAASGIDVVLVGRAESFLTGHPKPLAEALRRLVAFADAGADCLYAPGVRRIEDISELVRAVAPKPVNVLLRPEPFPSIAALEDQGVRRVSVGGALALAAWDGFARAAAALRQREPLAASVIVNHATLDTLFKLERRTTD